MPIPLLILLVALIVRNMGFEYRGKRDDDTWRKRWEKVWDAVRYCSDRCRRERRTVGVGK